jgi:hypothetical protein
MRGRLTGPLVPVELHGMGLCWISVYCTGLREAGLALMGFSCAVQLSAIAVIIFLPAYRMRGSPFSRPLPKLCSIKRAVVWMSQKYVVHTNVARAQRRCYVPMSHTTVLLPMAKCAARMT